MHLHSTDVLPIAHAQERHKTLDKQYQTTADLLSNPRPELRCGDEHLRAAGHIIPVIHWTCADCKDTHNNNYQRSDANIYERMDKRVKVQKRG